MPAEPDSRENPVPTTTLQTALDWSTKRMPPKARKLVRDPLGFLHDSRFRALRRVGAAWHAGLTDASSHRPPAEELDALAIQFGTDKSSKHHNYVRYYGPYFASYRGRPINFLEIGVKDGASLQMWKAFLPQAKVVGLDNRAVAAQYATREIAVHVGLQQDHAFLDRVAASVQGPFDIVLDDGSHHNPFTIESFRGLFKHVAPGGIYAIEDLHCSYEEHKLFDNERKQMTDFFIELINAADLNGRRDIYAPIASAQDFAKVTPSQREKLTYLERWVESVHFYQGLVFIMKRQASI